MYIPGRVNYNRQSIVGVRQSECGSSTMAMATPNGPKKPMSPSEFFAKIYGDNRPTSSTSAEVDRDISNVTDVVNHKPIEQDNPVLTAQQQRTAWLYPAWNPEFWTQGNRPFYNPLSLPPALTALSKI